MVTKHRIRFGAAAFVCGLLLAGLATAEDALRLTLRANGRAALTAGAVELLQIQPKTADVNWGFAREKKTAEPQDGTASFLMSLVPDAPPELLGKATVRTADGGADCVWTFTRPDRPMPYNCLGLGFILPVEIFKGGHWKIDGASGEFPLDYSNQKLAKLDAAKEIVLTDGEGQTLTLTLPEPLPVQLEDYRSWDGSDFELRIGHSAGELPAGGEASVRFRLGSARALAAEAVPDKPVDITAGEEWVPLADEREIVSGSALDFSGMGFTAGECGSRGRVIVNRDGHFAFADAPETARRFYGANLCFTAQYLPHADADALLDRWVKMGYNSLRIHHYEKCLTKKTGDAGFDWDPEMVDRLCYLVAGCAKRGIWLTTDLFVSRPVAASQISLPVEKPYAGGNGMVPMDAYKALLMVHEPAYLDWCAFTEKLLNTVNPYTRRRLADEPALAWICLVNEIPLSLRHWIARLPQWKTAWNRWLAEKFPARADLAAALTDLREDEDPAQGTVALPANLSGGTPRSWQVLRFVADTETAMVRRMKSFLREKIKCPALLTNHNCGPHTLPDQDVTREFDYVDDHYYIDHPIFTEKNWQLPSWCPNRNPVLEGAIGGRWSAALRTFGKPMSVSEFNYSAPGRFRGTGGVLTGAMAAVQDWDVLWRFAYSHNLEGVVKTRPLNYFDLARDPLAQAADRAAVLLFLRGDLQPAEKAVAVAYSPEELIKKPETGGLGGHNWLAWNARIGCQVPGVEPPAGVIARTLAQTSDRAGTREALTAAGVANLQTAPGRAQIGGRGEIALDCRRGIFTVDTPRSAGGYAGAGQTLDAPGCGVKVDCLDTGATVFVMSLTREPVKKSPRLLVTHLTDLQNSGARFAEETRQTLQAWGDLPHLVRNGRAEVRIALDAPGRYKVWALSPGGRRLENLPAKADGKVLTFTAGVKGAEGARMFYEIAAE